MTKWKGDHASVIEVLVNNNPKRAGSLAQQHFALYESGMTVADYVVRCWARKNGEDGLRFVHSDLDHHFIRILLPGTKLG